MKKLRMASLVSFLMAGCAASLGGGSSEPSAPVQQGHFFGHDLRNDVSVVYVLDLSGSMSAATGSEVEQAGTRMAGDAAGRLTRGIFGSRTGAAVQQKIEDLNKRIEKVKLHLIASLSGLPRGARFNVVLFSDGVQKLSPGMIYANGFTVAAISAFVAQLKEGGSTNMYEAVDAALATGARHLILLTDGEPTSSTPQAILDLVHRRNRGGRLTVSTVGVGEGGQEFLATLAAQNGGSYAGYN